MFLQEVSKYWNVILFTASYREYAEKILNKFDPTSELIPNVLTRENCTRYNEHFIKDFRIIANTHFDKNDMLMIDNKLISFAYNLHNGIPILPFYNDMNDTELRDILPLLNKLSSKSVNIKEYLKEKDKYNRFYTVTSGKRSDIMSPTRPRD